MTDSAERDARVYRGAVNDTRETLGWERIRVQIDSGAIDTVGPNEIAEAFEMKETIVSKSGIELVAANRSGIRNSVEQQIIG